MLDEALSTTQLWASQTIGPRVYKSAERLYSTSQIRVISPPS